MISVELPEHLATIAEVAAAFTGFAGLVSVLGRSNLDPKIRFWRVELMIITSLGAMFGALIPGALSLVIANTTDLWRIASFALFLIMFGQLLYVYLSMPPEQSTGPLRMFYGLLPSFLTIFSLLFQVCLVAVSVGYNQEIASATYVFALVFLLLGSAFHFLRLVKGSQPNVAT
jgi:hypothetical protein